MTRRDPQVFHATLGISRANGDTSTCSKCGAMIDEDAVPLMIFSERPRVVEGGVSRPRGHDDLMWCYCEKCEQGIARLLLR